MHLKRPFSGCDRRACSFWTPYIVCFMIAGCDNTSTPLSPHSSLTSSVESPSIPAELLARALASRGMLDMSAANEFKPLLDTMANRTRFERRVQVNSSFLRNGLNVYLVMPNASDATNGKCAYVGDGAIFCDSGFLRDYVYAAGILNDVPATRHNLLVRAFQTWVLSHEVAHADLQHVPSHFATAFALGTQAGAMASHGTELAADLRSLEISGQRVSADRDEMLVLLFNLRYKEKYGPTPASDARLLLIESDPSITYPYSLDGSHPDWTVRCSRMLAISATTDALRAEARDFIGRSAAPRLLDQLAEPSRHE